MTAAARALKLDIMPRAGHKAWPVVNSDTVWPRTLVGLDPSDGMLKPWANTAGLRFRGIAMDGQTTSKEVAGDGTGATTNRMRVDETGMYLRGVTVAGATALTTHGDLVYSTTDNPNDDLTLTPTLSAGPVGRIVFWTGTAAICDVELLTPEEAARAAEVHTLTIPITLAQITGAGDVASAISLPNAGHIVSLEALVKVVVTTGGDAATLNLEIGTTNLTGGEVALTSANCTPLGARVAGSAITAGNRFAAGDTLSVEAASVTAFAEGEVFLLIRYRLDP